ncbi:hypothetical protein P3S67_027846 [Capsicum chacoense]
MASPRHSTCFTLMGKKLVFVTNNSTKSRTQYAKKFHSLGIPVNEDEIFSSSFSAAMYLKVNDFPREKKVYVIGEEGILEELEQAGFTALGGPADGKKNIELKSNCLFEHDKSVGAVIVGLDQYINFYKLQYATLCIRENPGCLFIATNRDAVGHLTDLQEWPGAGCMVAAVCGTTQKEPITVGKPSTFLMDFLLQKYKITTSRMCMVGDRLDTDILFGQNAGCRTLLVFSGQSTMDRRSWPWKKKSSDKTASEKPAALIVESASAPSDSTGPKVDQGKQEIKKPKYVQISVESYSHLTGLEDQVKSLEEQVSGLEDEVKDLNEKLAAAQSEMTNKENLGKQYAEVAEEAVSGWEKAAKQFDKMKHEFEAKLANLDQQLLRSAAENSALSRSLKSNIESCEREINSLKYELHINSKELEIRIEEKNMSVRFAEVANKQHLEGVKKIATLEADCRRLRGLVRKKLPGPSALAQMKLEVESLGRDYGDSRVKKSQGGRPSSPQFSSLPDFSLDSVQKFHKENEQLTERLLAMDEETKMLKEALAHRNSELQTSRSICAKTASKLQNLEAQLQANAEQKSPQKSTIRRQHSEGSFTHETNHLPRLASISEDGNDDNVSCSSSWTTALMSELSHVKKEKNFDIFSYLHLMDDFLEMEKLVYQSSDTNGIPV